MSFRAKRLDLRVFRAIEGIRPSTGTPVFVTVFVISFILIFTLGCGSDDSSNAIDAATTDVAGSDGTAADTRHAADATVDGTNTCTTSTTGQGQTAAKPVDPLQSCTLNADLPSGLVEIAWDDGKAVTSVDKQAQWSVVGKKVQTQSLHEAVRFDITRPMRVHGFRIQYGVLPAIGQVTAGLYRDFGHNGFDFWSPDPIWQVSCPVAKLKPETWVTFAFPKPVTLTQPGLVYVAHRRDGAKKDAAAWATDGSLHPDCKDVATCCGAFARCHSAWNFPEITTFTTNGQNNYNWNGLSLSRPLDYLVRLIVEPLPTVAPKDTMLQPLGTVQPGHRMAWGDYDNDGWADLFDSQNRLFRNVKGVLTDVSKEAGLKNLDVKGNGGIWGDFDNDGHLDLFVFWENNQGGDTLLRNKGDGTFEDVTKASGITDIQDYNFCDDKAKDGEKKTQIYTPTAGATWVDIDADGKLDLYVSNFICWSLGTYYFDTIWHNEGGGKFVDWTGKNGFFGRSGTAFAGRGANAADADGDGDVDIFINNYRLHRNLYYRNQGDGTVAEVGRKVGLAGDAVTTLGATQYGHSIGTAWGDLNGDGQLDLVVANLAHPRFWNFSDKTQILLNDGKGSWTDIQGDWSIPVGAAGVRYQETHSVPVLADFDLDGVLDLAISATYDGRPSDFYWGNGDGTFELDVLHAGLTVHNGWGMAVADINHDGAPDLAAKGVVFINTRQGLRPGKCGPNLGHWLQVRAVGDVQANRAAIGATIRVKIGAKMVLRSVSGGNGQGCQDSLVQHIGLGAATQVDGVDVVFPGGKKTSFVGPFKADQRLWLFESGKISKGWAPPKP